MEDGLGADVSNSQTVRVRPLSRQGIQDYGLRTYRDPTRKIRIKLGGITVLPSLYTGMEAFLLQHAFKHYISFTAHRRNSL